MSSGDAAALHFDARWFGWLSRRPGTVRVAAVAAGAGALLLVPRAQFDPDVLRMRDPGTESVQVFEELLDENGVTSPWFANVVAPDLASADALAAELRSLPAVSRALTLSDYVPGDRRRSSKSWPT